MPLRAYWSAFFSRVGVEAISLHAINWCTLKLAVVRFGANPSVSCIQLAALRCQSNYSPHLALVFTGPPSDPRREIIHWHY